MHVGTLACTHESSHSPTQTSSTRISAPYAHMGTQMQSRAQAPPTHVHLQTHLCYMSADAHTFLTRMPTTHARTHVPSKYTHISATQRYSQPGAHNPVPTQHTVLPFLHTRTCTHTQIPATVTDIQTQTHCLHTQAGTYMHTFTDTSVTCICRQPTPPPDNTCDTLSCGLTCPVPFPPPPTHFPSMVALRPRSACRARQYCSCPALAASPRPAQQATAQWTGTL